MPTDIFTDDLAILANDELFDAIERFATLQPVEGWRHDYTLQWGDSALQKVAAFAHTFGGVVIVGVKKQKGDTTCELVGVESQTEYKTRIASSIASNISPVPSYDIFECNKPGEANRRFCVVRVRESKALHLLTKKGLFPVYVRNEDQDLPANAAQLRRLIDREREISTLASRVGERASQLRDAMVIGCGYRGDGLDTWYGSPHQNSQTFLRLMLVPTETISLELEKTHEDTFRKLIGALYPRVQEYIASGIANRATRRGADFYDFAFYHKDADYEMRWRISNSGGVGFASQMDHGRKFWSVVDVAHYIILLVKLTMKWWEFIRYFGDGRLQAQLNIPGLTVLQAEEGYYIQSFDPCPTPRVVPRDIRKDAIVLGALPGNAANAETTLNYFSGKEGLSKLTVSLLNQLLRSLGHAVVWNLLEASVDSLVRE